MWRALREKLPTNKKIVKFGQELKQFCYCYDPWMDTIDHIFISRHFTKHVWKHFANSYGIDCGPLPLSFYDEMVKC